MRALQIPAQGTFDFTGAAHSVATPRIRGDNIFLALKPQAEDAKRIERYAVSTCRDLGLGHNRTGADRLHVTMFGFGPPRDWPRTIFKDIDSRMTGFEGAPVDIAFPTLSCFGGNSIVLRAGPGGPVARLRRSIVARFRGAYMRAESFQAHMTICRSPMRFHDVPVEPIPWRASELVLVRSIVGRRRHETIGCWELAASPEAEGAPIEPLPTQLGLDLD